MASRCVHAVALLLLLLASVVVHGLSPSTSDGVQRATVGADGAVSGKLRRKKKKKKKDASPPARPMYVVVDSLADDSIGSSGSKCGASSQAPDKLLTPDAAEGECTLRSAFETATGLSSGKRFWREPGTCSHAHSGAVRSQGPRTTQKRSAQCAVRGP